MKTCSKCKIGKEASDFHKCSSSKDGLQSTCKSCMVEVKRQWRSVHEPRKVRPVGSWEDRNQPRVKEYRKIYRELNREKLAKLYRKYYLLNKEEHKTRSNISEKKAREEISEWYVRKCILQKYLPTEKNAIREIIKQYPQITELKRLEIKTKRALKQMS